MIFQTETCLQENGDKLGADKANVEQAVQQLKDAHKSGDITAIDNAINNLNNVMQSASQRMYQQAGAGQPGADPNSGAGAGFQGGQQAQSNPNDDVQDADFEEVK
jgi:molecular chaperone DnaK